jgi:hypothetical protein
VFQFDVVVLVVVVVVVVVTVMMTVKSCPVSVSALR